MKMFVVRAGKNGNDIELNKRYKIACVGFTVPIDLKHIHDLATIEKELEIYKNSVYINETLYSGYQSEAGRRRIASQLLLFAHDIEKNDLVFTPDPIDKIIYIGKVIKPYLYYPSRHGKELLAEKWAKDEEPRFIRHILEEVYWYEKTLPRKEMPETICTPGPGKKGVDRQGTVYQIDKTDPDCRRDLLNEMKKLGLEL
jgi:predicted Mrr-cat superfamily restriction endonuclease